jgi:hypothetical protein
MRVAMFPPLLCAFQLASLRPCLSIEWIFASRASLVEVEAVKLAIVHSDAAWEDEIVASFHLLERMFLRLRDATAKPDVNGLESRHQRSTVPWLPPGRCPR